ncbi:MAG TPA: zf-HC2 domain-containing protein [Candidatus Acidoferrales bacterium]|nr:zf-HC2 domain-containing protein [Candidatus Acidoferrales bacterium]
MTCNECRELLTDYQRGELPAAQDAAVFEHVSACSQCREELTAQTELTATLREAFASEFEMPTSILAGVRQSVRQERKAAFGNALRSWLRPVVLAPSAAAIVLIASIATYVHNGSAPPQVSAEYLVRQHVVHTLNSQSGDRAWNAYLLTSSTNEDANAAGK